MIPSLLGAEYVLSIVKEREEGVGEERPCVGFNEIYRGGLVCAEPAQGSVCIELGAPHNSSETEKVRFRKLLTPIYKYDKI